MLQDLYGKLARWDVDAGMGEVNTHPIETPEKSKIPFSSPRFPQTLKDRTARVRKNEGSELLGSSKGIWKDDNKDDEERRLESVLFGKPCVPSLKVRTGGESDEVDGIPEADVGLVGNEFANLMDLEVPRTHAHERAIACI